MGARGTQAIALVDRKVMEIPRAQPPEELGDEESVECLTNRMPADYFGREHFPLMVQLCRHTVAARHIAEMVKNTTAPETLHRIIDAQE